MAVITSQGLYWAVGTRGASSTFQPSVGCQRECLGDHNTRSQYEHYITILRVVRESQVRCPMARPLMKKAPGNGHVNGPSFAPLLFVSYPSFRYSEIVQHLAAWLLDSVRYKEGFIGISLYIVKETACQLLNKLPILLHVSNAICQT